MSCGLVFTFVLAFTSLYNYVQGHKPCKLEDIKCITKACQVAFEIIVPGIEGVCEPLDPLHLATIEGEYASLKYKVTNTTLTGMKDCLNSLVKNNPEESKFRLEFVCPKLVLNYSYIASGYIGPVEIDGKGSPVITLDYYKIILDGTYGKYISKKDKKLHFFVTTFNPDFESRGNVSIEINGSLHSDPAKNALAAEFIAKNEKYFEVVLRSIMMRKFTERLMKAIDNYIRAHFVEDILYE